MFAATRTPPKRNSNASTADKDELPAQSKVRTSIGEWETSWISHNPLKSPPKKAASTKAKTATAAAKTLDRRPSAEASGSASVVSTHPNRVAEARACLNKAKLNLSNSRNLKAEIKDAVIAALDRLYQLVKEAEADKRPHEQKAAEKSRTQEEKVLEKERPCVAAPLPQQPAMDEQFFKKLEEHSRLLKETGASMAELKEKLDSHHSSLERTTYASVAAGSSGRKPPQPMTLHSVVVTSKDETVSGEEVLEIIRKAVKAKEGGVYIDRIRKGKDRKVIMGCKSQEEMRKVKERLEKGKDLHVEEMKNKDPLIVLYGVLQKNTDEDVIKAIKLQNKDLLNEIKKEDDRIEVRFRRRTRNPLTAHIVCRVSPLIWQRLTAAGSVRIDLQRVGVADQSPLVQCSRCLGYGHGRRFCQDAADVCSHCGGQHRRTECAEWLAGMTPSCVNCCKIKADKIEHNAFSSECPVRCKWEALARSAVAYC